MKQSQRMVVISFVVMTLFATSILTLNFLPLNDVSFSSFKQDVQSGIEDNRTLIVADNEIHTDMYLK